MTLQIGRIKLFILSVFQLIFIFFAPNIRMLLRGEQANGTVFKLSAFTAGEHNSRVNFIASNKKEYRFEVNSNIKGTAKVIYDPNNPEDAYLFNFMNFVLEKIIYSLLAAIPSTIFVFFFLKKNQYLFIDLKRFKFTKGLKKWTETDEMQIQQFIANPFSNVIKPFEYAYLANNDVKFTQKLISVTLQHLFLSKQIVLTQKLVQVNKTDDKQKPRPFVSLGPNYSEVNNLSSVEHELLSIFSNDESLRLHEIRQKLQQKYGVVFERFHSDIVKPYFEQSPFFSQGKPNDTGRFIYSEITSRLTFIDKHIDDLTGEHLVTFSNLLDTMQDTWLFIPTETLEKIKIAFTNHKDEISQEILSKISSSYQRISIN